MRIAMPARWARRLTPSPGESEPDVPPTADEIYNGKLLQLEAPFAGLALIAVPGFYAFFAILMGASNTTVGWLTAGPALVSLLWLIPCSQLIQRSNSVKTPLLVGVFVHRFLLIALAFVPLLPASLRATGLVILVALIALPLQLWGLAFDTLTGDMFSPRHFARIIGRRWAGIDLSGMAALFLLGKLVDAVAFPLNWMLLVAGIGSITLVSIVLMARLRVPERLPLPPSAVSDPNGGRLTPRALWRDHRAFILLELGVLFVYLAMFAAVPILRIYWVRELSATGAWVGGLTAAFSGGAVLGSLVWGPQSRPGRDRRNCLLGGLGAIGFYPIATALSTSLTPLVAIVAAAGFFIVGNDLMIYKRVIAASPRQQRATLIAIHNLVFSAVAFVAPLVSTAVADRLGARLTLIGIGVGGLLGALFFYRFGWGRLCPMAAD